MKKVVIVQRRMTHYRIELFNCMRELLAQKKIDLQVIYSDPDSLEVSKKDSATLAWGIYLPAHYLLGGRVCWFNPGRYLRNADLVVIPQENKIIYLLFLVIVGTRYKLAYWGHGRNLQPQKTQQLSEELKSWLINRVDWWFAYTGHTLSYLKCQGVTEQKITVLNNTIDTEEFVTHLSSITQHEQEIFLNTLSLHYADDICIYCGSLNAEKSIDFLLSSAVEIKKQRKKFVLLVIGAGSEKEILDLYAAQYSWIIPLGALKGKEKALVFSLAKLLLIPSAIGLVAIDALVAGVPIVTRENEKHGPEIAYLTHDLTAIITEKSENSYVDAVCSLLANPEKISSLSKAGLLLRDDFTISSMANRFSQGIISALKHSDSMR